MDDTRDTGNVDDDDQGKVVPIDPYSSEVARRSRGSNDSTQLGESKDAPGIAAGEQRTSTSDDSYVESGVKGPPFNHSPKVADSSLEDPSVIPPTEPEVEASTSRPKVVPGRSKRKIAMAKSEADLANAKAQFVAMRSETSSAEQRQRLAAAHNNVRIAKRNFKITRWQMHPTLNVALIVVAIVFLVFTAVALIKSRNTNQSIVLPSVTPSLTSNNLSTSSASSVPAAAYYLHWSCGGVTQCEQTMGAPSGVANTALQGATACQQLQATWASRGYMTVGNSAGGAGTWCSPNP